MKEHLLLILKNIRSSYFYENKFIFQQGKPGSKPKTRPTQTNSPKEIKEAIDSSKKMANAMIKLKPKMKTFYNERGDQMAGGKLVLHTEDKKEITLYMQGEHGLWVSSGIGKTALLFSREGDYFSLNKVLNHSQPYVSGGPVVYKYNPTKVEGNAKEYTNSVNTFLKLLQYNNKKTQT